MRKLAEVYFENWTKRICKIFLPGVPELKSFMNNAKKGLIITAIIFVVSYVLLLLTY